MPSILFCACANAVVVPAEVKDTVRRQLRGANQPFLEVADLCGLSARKDPVLQRVAASQELRIVACYPRAVQWLFAAAGAPLQSRRVEFLNMRAQSAEQITAALLAPPGAEGVERDLAGADLTPPVEPSAKSTDPRTDKLDTPWSPWFPVIDFERCTQCMQCLSFCLFGVFGINAEQHLEVQRPESCKTNCPACSRVCPEGAIIFPKYKNGPINGAPILASDVEPEKVKVDVSALLGGDVYERLRERGKRAETRFSKDRDAAAAFQRRQKCLAKLIELGDIPPEVWRDLPSVEEMERRAEQARATAQLALDRPGNGAA